MLSVMITRVEKYSIRNILSFNVKRRGGMCDK